jgi:hypothetical protein
MRDAGGAAGLRVFPIASDLAGPRSDHVPFEDRGVPVLFFSCGIFGDYHGANDTADRLDFGLVDRSARVILSTVRTLADGAPVVHDPTHRWEEDELRSIRPVFQEVLAQPRTAGIAGFPLKGFLGLASESDRFLREGGYDWNARRDMILEATPALAARLGIFRPSDISFPDELPYIYSNVHAPTRLIQYFNITYPADLRQAYREAMVEVFKHRPGLLRTMPRFEYEIYRIDPKETRLMETSPGVFLLAAPAVWFTLVADPRPSLFSFHSTPVEFGLGVKLFEEEGSREALADFWLLELRDARAHPQRAEQIRAVLRLVLGREPAAGYAAALPERLKQGGFRDESEWIAQIVRSRPGWLAARAVKAAANGAAPMREVLAALIRDRTAPSEARVAAILEAESLRGRQMLLALGDVLDDRTVSARKAYTASPFPTPTILKLLLMDAPAGAAASRPPRIVGNVAWSILEIVSGKEFSDQAAWRAWAAKQPEAKAKR